ncbi:DUF6279 family lipoprotein [Paracidovorax sp. MALMAid1276]|uniref:DUF6279 family lipoprotein n=1 Tax=Paracidovorax sp. MALMAid1276 TaxID=3411631 RepID=UPI003B9BD8FD
MHLALPLLHRKTLRSAALLAASALLLQACSTVKLAYHQAPQLVQWQINSYLDLSQDQAERVRGRLDELHQWHRDTMLPRHAALLQQLQRQLPESLSPEQACSAYAQVRGQVDAVLAQAEPSLAWLATQLTDAQIRHLQKKQARSNADWKKEWLDVAPEQLREHRFKQLTGRAEGIYGPLDAPQKAALRSYIAQSSFDAQRTYAERLRRQQDLVQTLESVARNRTDTDQARRLVRGYLERLNQSPDAAYQRYARTLVQEGCEGFARVHEAMAPAQRSRAVQSIKGYADDFLVLAAR